QLNRQPFPQQAHDIPLGLYGLPRRSGEAHLYRLNHPLAEALIAQAKRRELPAAQVRFDYSHYDGRITALEPFVGTSGWLMLSLFSVASLDQAEDHLLLAAITDDGQTLPDDVAARLMSVGGTSAPLAPGDEPGRLADALDDLTQQRQAAIQRAISERNARFFEVEAEKLDGWADDLKSGLEREIKEIDRLIKEARRAATLALTLEEKLAGQKQVKALEAQRNQKRRSLFDAQDQVDTQRAELIEIIEGKLNQVAATQQLFFIRWVLQ
nr:DEAD/DEAH box helicase [Chloroflexota bacterium]